MYYHTWLECDQDLCHNLISCCFCHRTCEQHKLAATYYASAVDKATETYFLLNQETKHCPKTWQVLEVLFLSNKLPAKAVSE